jgi:hypothetical protein
MSDTYADTLVSYSYMDDVEKFLFNMLSNNEKVIEGIITPLRLILYQSPYSHGEPTIYWVTIEYREIIMSIPEVGIRSSLYQTLEREINSKAGKHLKAYFNITDYISYQLDISCTLPLRDWLNLYKERGLFE